jgi:predicted nucleic acid-binding protein
MPVYVDTAALIALAHKRDSLHEKTVAVYRKLLDRNTRFVTTNAVLLEVGNTFSRSLQKSLAIFLFRLVNDSSFWEVVPVDGKWFTAGMELFQKRNDKDWSLTDCIGIVVAESYTVKSVFTSDRHFQQAGFKILL